MEPQELNQIAADASSLASRAMTVQSSEDLRNWIKDFRAVLAAYFTNGRLEQSLADALDAKTLGLLVTTSEWLAGRTTLTMDTRPIARDKLNAVAAILRSAANAASSAPPAQVPSPIYRVGEWRLLEEPLGRGGQGSVVLVWNEVRFQRGALKRPRGDKELTEKAKARFLREIRVFKSTRHPFILKILDAAEDEQSELFLVTEVAPFGSLKDNASVYVGDALRTLRLARDIARGLDAVHAEGIVHRDLKPENLLLYSLDHPLVGDFGIAHFADQDGVTSIDERVGSYWFAPREYERKVKPTAAFDVFSLGAIVHWTLSGAGKLDEPYRVMTAPRSLADQFGASRLKPLDGLLDQMLKSDPEKRPQSMGAVIAEIDHILGQLLAGGGLGSECAFCGRGTHRDIGAVRLAGGTEISVWETESKGVSLQSMQPRMLVCDNCGDIRWRTEKPPK